MSFSPSHAAASCAFVKLFHGCGLARRCRQSTDFGWWQRTKLGSRVPFDVSRGTSSANGLPRLDRLDVIGRPITMLVRALNAFGDRTSIGRMSRIWRPTCGLQSIQITSPRSGTQVRDVGGVFGVRAGFVGLAGLAGLDCGLGCVVCVELVGRAAARGARVTSPPRQPARQRQIHHRAVQDHTQRAFQLMCVWRPVSVRS